MHREPVRGERRGRTRRVVGGIATLLACAVLAFACRGATQDRTPKRGATEVPTPSIEAVVAPAPSPGCLGGASAAAGPVTETITVSGTSRTYRRFVPDAAGGVPLPVVINLHGLLSNIDQQVVLTGFETLAARERFVVLTPQGVGNPSGWSLEASAHNPDIAFINAMLDAVEAGVCVDRARVYSTGLSNGGIMSALLACYEPDRIAAVGLVSGITRPSDCAASRPVPMIVFWGKQDPVLPYCGGVGPVIIALLNRRPFADAPPPTCPPASYAGFPPVEDVVGAWGGAYGCAKQPAVTQISAHVERRDYGGCAPGAALQFYVVADGGHSWPGSAAMAALSASPAGKILGRTTDEIDASALIWQFFRSYAVSAKRG